MGQFGVAGVEKRGAGGSVIGRCYAGILRVGDEFTSLVDVAGKHYLVRLAIVRIEAYGRELNEIDEGLTARLSLNGEGWEHLEDNAVLSTSCASTIEDAGVR